MYECINDLPLYQCKCLKFQTHSLMNLKAHFRAGHKPQVSNENVYKCTKCHFESHSRFVMFGHSFINCVPKNKNQAIQIKKEHNYADSYNFPAIDNTSSVICLNTFNKNQFRCQKCPFVFGSFAQLQQHWLRHKKEFKCEKCPSIFKHKQSLKKHMLSYHKNREEIQLTESESVEWFQCAKCPYKSRFKHNFNSHVTMRHIKLEEINWFPCDKCNKKFRLKATLRKHVFVKHTNPNEIEFHCKKCTFKTRIRNNLVKHVINYHSDSTDNNGYKCGRCGSRFNYKKGLSLHVTHCKTSESIRWLRCKLCPAKYKNKHSLNKHVRDRHSNPESI